MRISDLLRALPDDLRPTLCEGRNDDNITALVLDSRKAVEGCLFAALPPSGQSQALDGRHFIIDALRRGARTILTTPEENSPSIPNTATVLHHPNPRAVLAAICGFFYAGQPETTIAITGTNGKSSVASFLQQLWAAQGRTAASLGTLGLVLPPSVPPLPHDNAKLTTPDIITLHQTLNHLHEKGVTHLALETSSHGLDQHRPDAVKLSAAGFTNLGRDHLDYHSNLDDYLGAKSRLFTTLLPADKTAVINTDDHAGQKIVHGCQGRNVLSTGRQDGADLRLLSHSITAEGQNLVLMWRGRKHHLHLPLVGDFQADNLLTALGLLLATGQDLESLCPLVEQLQPVPGRLERIGQTKSGACVYVDFAHTPDALDSVLSALRPHCHNRLCVVMGCGGDRDPGKRGEMGRIAATKADLTTITDDNPRTEDAAKIRTQIMAGVPTSHRMTCTLTGDRRTAIRNAVTALAPGDCLVIAGKGHEDGQIVGDEKRPFDDRNEVREALLAEMGGRS